jgi:hypothetical protein
MSDDMPDGRGTPEYDEQPLMIDVYIQSMQEELDDLQKFSDDTYKFVRNLHSRAMRMYLDSGRIPSLELKGQEHALWKVLKFMGAPLNDRSAMEEG